MDTKNLGVFADLLPKKTNGQIAELGVFAELLQKPKEDNSGVLGTIKNYGKTADSALGLGISGIEAGLGNFVQAPAANTLSFVKAIPAVVDRGMTNLINAVSPGEAVLYEPAQKEAQMAAAFAAESRDENVNSKYNVVAKAGKWVQDNARNNIKEIEANDAATNPELIRQQQEIGKAEGFTGNVAAAFENPMAFTHTLVKSVPDMALGLGAGRLAASRTLATETAVAEAAAARVAAAGGDAVAQKAAVDAAINAVREKATAAASTAGMLSEGVSSANSSRESTYSQIVSMPFDKLEQSPRFNEILKQVGDKEKAREVLANEVADQTPIMSGGLTVTGTLATNRLFGGDATAKVLAGVDKASFKNVIKDASQEGVEEVFQGVPQGFSDHQAMQIADPSKQFDLGGEIAQNALGGFAMGGGGHSGAYAFQKAGELKSVIDAKRVNPSLAKDSQSDISNQTAEKPSEAEAALMKPKNISTLDRVGEIDNEIGVAQSRFGTLTPENGYGPTFDDERQELAQSIQNLKQERDQITQAWPKAIPGADTSFSTEAGVRLGAKYALMEASDLQTSHDENLRANPAYPPELQPRERDRAASSAQISNIVSKIDPARLGLSADAATGAPIVGADGLVESGNARTIALKRVFRANGQKAENYKAYLAQNAEQFGLDPNAIASMQQPVLVRVRTTPVNRAEFARQANASTVARMSPVEQARSDAARLDILDDLHPDENGDFTTSRDFVRRFMAKVPQTEVGEMMDSDGRLSPAGYARMRNAILAKAYGDSPVILRMTDSLDDNLRNVSKALMQVAPQIAKVRSGIKEGYLHDTDITPDLMGAVEELSRIKEQGGTVKDYLSQSGMFEDKLTPEGADMLRFLDENIRRPRQMAEFILRYTQALEAMGNPGQANMFDEDFKPTKSELLTAARRDQDVTQEPASREGTSKESEVSVGQDDSKRVDARSDEESNQGNVENSRGQTEQLAKPEVVDGWAGFGANSGTLGIPRVDMPQIKAEHRGAMVNFLKARDIESTQDVVKADTLKPTQAEYSPEKVEKAKAYEGGDRSILVSSDNHVLDGHHQWLAKKESGEDVKIIRLDAPIDKLLETVKEFPSAETSQESESAATVEQQDKVDTASIEKIAEGITATRMIKEEQVPDLVPALEKVIEQVLPETGADKSKAIKAAKDKLKSDGKTKKIVNLIKPETYEKAADKALSNAEKNNVEAGSNRKSVDEIKAELEQITDAVKERTKGYDLTFDDGPDVKFMTPEEKERRHELIQQLPSYGEEAKAAKERNSARIANRKAAKKDAPVKEVQNTEDAGDELAANKRNRMREGLTWEDIKDKDASLRVRDSKKSNVFPKPEYENLIASGMEPVVAYMVKQVYDSLAAAPTIQISPEGSDPQLKKYIDSVHEVMKGTMAWATDKENIVKWVAKLGARASLSARASTGMAVSLSDLARAEDKPLLDYVYPDGWRTHKDAIRVLGGNRVLTALQPSIPDAIKALKEIEKGWPAKQEAWQKQGYKTIAGEDLEVSYYESKASSSRPSYVSVTFMPKTSRLGSSLIQETFDEISSKDDPKVQEWVAKTMDRLKGKTLLLNKQNRVKFVADSKEAAIEKAREFTKKTKSPEEVSDKGISVEAASRTGEDYRMPDEDISSEKLMETFGFRGINFGNWMKGDGNTAERQLHLNHIYDAFMDLAGALDLPPKAMSLNGMLGIAVGAQGNGKYAAHFVPGFNEINLTRTSGAGALAHEWAHALDHYFARQADLASNDTPYLTEFASLPAKRNRMVQENGKYVNRELSTFGDGIRLEIVDKFKNIVEAMKRRPISIGEQKLRNEQSIERAKKNTDSWLKSIKRDFDSIKAGEDVMASLDELSKKIMRLELGDGKIAVSSSTSISQPLQDIRDLYKKLAGRTYSLDKVKALQSNIDHYQYVVETKDDFESHKAQEVSTKYAKDAAELDGDKGGKAYWSTSLEMFARAFDAFIEDKLAQKAARNTYLHSRSNVDPVAPVGEDRQKINANIQELINTIDHKQTDDGGVALFSRGNKTVTIDGIERPIENSSGKPIAATEEGVKNFWRWFGDSKVVDDNGNPLPVYHGTASEINQFDKFALGTSTGAPSSKLGFFFSSSPKVASGYALLAESSTSVRATVLRNASQSDILPKDMQDFLREAADTLAPTWGDIQAHSELNGTPGANVLPIYLSIKNPLVIDYKGQEYREVSFAKAMKKAISENHDGLILRNAEDSAHVKYSEFSDIYIAFKPEQIKSATGNSGEFDGENPDIRFKMSPSQQNYMLGMPTDLLREKVEGITKGWGNVPKINYVDFTDELPFPAPSNVRGAFYRGQVYLVASNIRNESEAQMVLFHETLGHAGLRGLFGNQLNSALTTLAQQNKPLFQAAKTWRDENSDIRGKRSDNEWFAVSVEESLAEIAETGKTILGLQKFLVKVQSLLRALNLHAVADWIESKSSAEVMSTLAKAKSFIEFGEEQHMFGSQEAQAYSMSDDEKVAEKPLSLEELLALSQEEITIEAPPPPVATREEIERAASVFLSTFPEGTTRHLPFSPTIRKAKRYSDEATKDLRREGGISVEAQRRATQSLGPFSGFFTEASLDQNFYGNEQLTIDVYGNEQIEAGLDDVPALKIELQQDGEFSIYALPSSSETYSEFVKRGWAEPATGKDKEIQYFTDENGEYWTKLSGVKQSQLLPLLGDIHARALAWTGQPYVGLHWQRTTGASGGIDGHRAAVLFSRKKGQMAPENSEQKSVQERAEDIIQDSAATAAPIDRLVRGATKLAQIDKITKAIYNGASFILNRYTPETLKAGFVSDYGVPEAVIDRRAALSGHMNVQTRKTGKLIDKLSTLTREESRVAYEWMNNSNPDALKYFEEQLPEESVKVLSEVKEMIESLSKEAVALGQLSHDAYEQNKMEYLRRSYAKHTLNLDEKEKKQRARAISILGDQYKGRGLAESASMKQMQNIAPDWWGRKLKEGKADTQLKGEKFVRLEKYAHSGEGTIAMDGIGDRSKGKLQEVVYFPDGEQIPSKYAEWDHAGTYEVRDTKGENVVLWRDFTKAEREQMGEIDEARFAIAKTLHGMIHDVEVGRYMEWLNKKFGLSHASQVPGNLVEAKELGLSSMNTVYKKGDWVQVPETKVAGTDAHKYGKLAGKYIPGPVWNDLRQINSGSFKPLGDVYSSILKAWKMSKTALSPAVHMNNVMANFVMADWHDVTAGHIAKSLRILMAASDRDGTGLIGSAQNIASRAGIADREAAKEIIGRYQDSGGNIGTWASAELQNEQIQPLLEALEAEMAKDVESVAAQVGVMNALQMALAGRFADAAGALTGTKTGKAIKNEGKNLIDLYQSEDEVFRLAAWLKAKEDGETDMQAGHKSRQSFLDYNINAPWMAGLRATAFPFAAFSYRAIPMMAETVAKRPWKVMKLAMIGGMLNALGYMLSGGNEDDERRYLPEEKAGRVWGMVPKLVRMPWNDTHGQPVFMDVRRFIPVGDVFDIDQQHSAVPLPPSVMPGGPMALIGEVVLNKSMFTGQAITEETDTNMEKVGKTIDYLYKSMAPNLPILPGTHSFDAIAKANSGGTDAFGRELSTGQAVLNSIGVKVGSYGQDTLRVNAAKKLQAEFMEIDHNINKLKREYARKGMTYEEFVSKVRDQQGKKVKLAEEFRGK